LRPAFEIRDATLPKDKPELLAFILGSQRFEKVFEPNRRLDEPVAQEHFDVLLAQVQKNRGRMLVAEGDGGQLLGWGVAHTVADDVFVVAEERTFGYISELFVIESMRGKGVGQALIKACESWARSLGLHVLRIGVLAGNERAVAIYQRAGFAPDSMNLRKYL
jgi:GNAT superfamily N-acetyltransferase